MKLYPILVQAVSDALLTIFKEQKYADKVLEKLLRSNPKWGSRDRAFIAETTYNCVRWWRLLFYLAGKTKQYESGQFNRADLYHIIAIQLLRQHGEGAVLPDWKEFGGLNLEKIAERNAQLQENQDVAVLYSVPDWLVEKLEATELAALNATAPLTLRCNTLKIKTNDLRQELAKIGHISHVSPLAADALILEEKANVFSTELFKKGYFEVQDAGSQLIAPFLEVQAGMRVVDACAGAGGKSLHLATLMQNKGKIISLDVEDWKLTELQKRAKRNGVHIVESRHIESTKVIKRLHDSADRLLLDVPCSGVGVLKRNPDAKWKLQPDFIKEIQATQQQILQDYSKILRVGGKMVYATCSLLPDENEEQVKRFVANNPQFVVEKEQTLRPSTHQTDGFYMALLIKKSLDC